MASYTIPFSNGTFTQPTRGVKKISHQLAVRVDGATAGTIEIQARGFGSGVYEIIPDGTINLDDPQSILFTFLVAEYKFIVSDVEGTANQIHITDSIIEV